MSYESAQQAQALAKEQRELAERMQQLQQTAEQLEKQLKQTGALDSALSARLQEAQKLLRDALTPELAEKLRKLEESAQKRRPRMRRRRWVTSPNSSRSFASSWRRAWRCSRVRRSKARCRRSRKKAKDNLEGRTRER
jgi:uncharacterized phage infection (PIP) family protein YhgE